MKIKKIDKITNKEFIKIVEESNTFTEISRKIGYSTARADVIEDIIIKCKELNLKYIKFLDSQKNRTRKSISKIDSFSDKEFIDIVKNADYILDIIRKMGYVGGTFEIGKKVKKRCEELNIDISHLKTSRDFSNWTQEEIFKENNDIDRKFIKKYIIEKGLIKYECYRCKNTGTWNGKPLVLELDHINGVNNDDRLENLRFCCPLCGTLLPTYTGRNKKEIRKKYYCTECGKERSRVKKNSKSSLCKDCYVRLQKENIKQTNSKNKIPVNKQFFRPSKKPPKEQLIKDIISMPMTKVGEKYGVSDNAVRKWCKSYELLYKQKEIKELKNELLNKRK